MKRKMVSMLLLCGMVMLLTACTSQGEETKKETETESETEESYRAEFSDEELASGSASFQAGEYIYVDASLTPQSVYQDGVESYYLNYYSYENRYTDEETLMDTLNPLDRSLDELETVVTEYFGEGLNRESLEYTIEENGAGVLMCSFGLTDGSYLTCWNNFFTGDSDADCYSPSLNYERTDWTKHIVADLDLLREYGGDLDFATQEEAAAQAIACIEELTGMEISDSWTCYTYNEENLRELEEVLKEEGEELLFDVEVYDTETGESDYEERTLDEIEYEEYYDFVFYLEVNGLPIEDGYHPSTYLYEGETVGDSIAVNPDNVSESAGTTTLQPIWTGSMDSAVDENGIVYLHASRIFEVGDVYKEESIKTPSDVLRYFLTYLEGEIVLDTITIEDISLVYVSAFTDAENGVVEAALRPYWKVTVYDEGMYGGRETYYYNATTGELWG